MMSNLKFIYNSFKYKTNRNIRTRITSLLGKQTLNSCPKAINSLCKVLLNDKDL